MADLDQRKDKAIQKIFKVSAHARGQASDLDCFNNSSGLGGALNLLKAVCKSAEIQKCEA